uniref:protein-tyrosine-phosphatase n=1 Tax=Phallusia mammillata TaxID=59560 RepID=A0A6F9DJD3_9ASCI|nr:uncharacterized protein LOC100187461 [Phallusia mammillata]
MVTHGQQNEVFSNMSNSFEVNQFNFSSINGRKQDFVPELRGVNPSYNEHEVFDTGESATESPVSDAPSLVVAILVPIACIAIVVILTFSAHRTWKYYNSVGSSNLTPTVDEAQYEESVPLSGIKPIICNKSNMQIVQETEIDSSTRSAHSAENITFTNSSHSPPPSPPSPRDSKQDVIIHALKPLNNSFRSLDNSVCERPKTLKFLAASVAFQNTTVPALKRLPYTPDPDYVLGDSDYRSVCNAAIEAEDKIAPLLCKSMKSRTKPGLLERRGSNVALTISLRAGEKSNSSNPATSKSPKPLTYLQQASSPLLPDEIQNKACDLTRLQKEFWEIPMNHPSEKHFSIAGHGTKNRYRTILPNEHSRVVLESCPGDEEDDALSTYINANYVRNCAFLKSPSKAVRDVPSSAVPVTLKNSAFIATQGPMANTIDDFWRMTWQQRVRSIIMITKLMERKEKCSRYLPINVGQSECFGGVTVKVESIRQFEHFSVRSLTLTNTDGESRSVNHYWYTTWMDHETPEKTRGLLELVQEVTRWKKDSHGPIAVHCSAGIGRTGCYIAVSVGCEQLLKTGKVDILRIVSQMRLDRGGMIQTWEQYQFVHQALSRYARILAGENVTTPSTNGSIRSPPAPIVTAPPAADPPRPQTPKHRRSLSGNSLPAPKELKVCTNPPEANNSSGSSPERTRSSRRKPKLRLGKLRDNNTAPPSPLPNDEAPSPRLGVVKSVSSPTIRSPFARLCLQAKDLNRSASPASSVKFEWPEPGRTAALDDALRAPPGGRARARKSDENEVLNNNNHSPSHRFSFDLGLSRGQNTTLCNGGSKPPSPYCETSPPGSGKPATPLNNCTHFVFPSTEGR